jgi:beta-carotene 3-hydroxylase
VTFALVVVVSFIAMEGVTYLTHRFVMHGFGMRWHRSHHRAAKGGFEKNDLFPVCFSTLGVAAFALGTAGPSIAVLVPVGVGMTLYGATYLFVHDVYIHERLPLPLGRSRSKYLRWLRDAHAEHHRASGEPYGMLFPVLRSARVRNARSTRARL